MWLFIVDFVGSFLSPYRDREDSVIKQLKSKIMLGTLKSGEPVVDRHRSKYHPSVFKILPKVLLEVSSNNRTFIKEVVDMGEIVGNTICVETNSEDEIFYAQRYNRKGLTRFVQNRKPIPSSKVCVILMLDDVDKKDFILITAFVGESAPAEPWDKNATENSRPFWDTHALIMDNTYDLVPGTATDICPW